MTSLKFSWRGLFVILGFIILFGLFLFWYLHRNSTSTAQITTITNLPPESAWTLSNNTAEYLRMPRVDDLPRGLQPQSGLHLMKPDFIVNNQRPPYLIPYRAS